MNNNRHIFSIIIPTFQEERVLEQTLAQFTSELKQMYNMEVIVSDGGSSDATLIIAKKYADKIIEANPKVHQTIAVGRNAGAVAADSDVLIFLDADVLIDDIQSFFATLSHLIEERRIIAVTCNVRVYQSEEGTSDYLFHQFYNKYFYFLNVIGIGMGRGECQIIRSNVFRELDGYNESMPAGEDFDMFTRLKKKGRILFAHTLTVRESPRRFRKYGYLYISGMWFANAMSVWLFRKSVVREWKPVR